MSLEVPRQSHLGRRLHIFLTLSESDLKEIGITLFGPRRKMMSAIQRSINEMLPTVKDSPVEIAYADVLAAKLSTLQQHNKELEMEKKEYVERYEQEQELRKVTESFLMEQRSLLSSLHDVKTKWERNQQHLTRIVDNARTSSLTSKFDNMRTKSGSRSSPSSKDRSSPQSHLAHQKDLDEILRSNRECLDDMQRILKQSTIVGKDTKR